MNFLNQRSGISLGYYEESDVKLMIWHCHVDMVCLT